jgi:hypothetical protein
MRRQPPGLRSKPVWPPGAPMPTLNRSSPVATHPRSPAPILRPRGAGHRSRRRRRVLNSRTRRPRGDRTADATKADLAVDELEPCRSLSAGVLRLRFARPLPQGGRTRSRCLANDRFPFGCGSGGVGHGVLRSRALRSQLCARPCGTRRRAGKGSSPRASNPVGFRGLFEGWQPRGPGRRRHRLVRSRRFEARIAVVSGAVFSRACASVIDARGCLRR